MIAIADRGARLGELLAEMNMESLLDPDASWFLARLDSFATAYRNKLEPLPRHELPRSAAFDDLLEEHRRNPHRVHALLQAVAFRCSPEMLSMMWMVLLGSRITGLHYGYERRLTSTLDVTIELPDHTTRLNFESSELRDLALLRLAGFSKGDGLPLIESFHPMAVPRRSD